MKRINLNKKSIVFVGVDPGANGAVAVINGDQDIILLEDWPGNEVAAANIIRNIIKIYAIKASVERVHSMPKQGVSSTFKFGTNYGIWKGILAAYQISFLEPSPQTWQKGILSKAQDKKPALATAARIFPEAELYGPRGGGMSGRADALLIADWCRRQYVPEKEKEDA